MHCMHSMHSTARARRTSPTGPQRSALEARKKQCFSSCSGGFRAQTLKLPARRAVALVGVSWRSPTRDTRKIYYFGSSAALLAACQSENKTASIHYINCIPSTARARRTSPTGPRRSALEACQKQCFSLYSGGFLAQTLKLPARRTAALVGAP